MTGPGVAKSPLKVFRALLFPVVLVAVACLLFPGETASSPYHRNLNAIRNAEALSPFYEKLKLLKKGQVDRVTVLHIGDSHIQPDFLTYPVRQSLQAHFGNAGRGLCFPYRVAGTNGPLDYRITGSSDWDSRRNIRGDALMAVGVTGFAIRSNSPEASLEIGLSANGCTLDGHSFDTMYVFHEKTKNAYDLRFRDEAGNEGVSKTHENGGYAASKFITPNPVCRARLTSVRSRDDQAFAQIYGISLEKQTPGVLYHSAGLNGATFEHFNTAQYFPEQVAILKPDLVIISLGTNSAFSPRFNESEMLRQMEVLIQTIRSQVPDAVVMLTTPPDCGAVKRRTAAQNVSRVRSLIVSYCSKTKTPCWDLFAVMGGHGSVRKWRKEGLAQADLIHFTRPGYEVQGKMLSEALFRGYRSYD